VPLLISRSPRQIAETATEKPFSGRSGSKPHLLLVQSVCEHRRRCPGEASSRSAGETSLTALCPLIEYRDYKRLVIAMRTDPSVNLARV
jgi:hypothetical protein